MKPLTISNIPCNVSSKTNGTQKIVVPLEWISGEAAVDSINIVNAPKIRSLTSTLCPVSSSNRCECSQLKSVFVSHKLKHSDFVTTGKLSLVHSKF